MQTSSIRPAAAPGRRARRVLTAAAVLMLAWGCGTRPPAPIEHRDPRLTRTPAPPAPALPPPAEALPPAIPTAPTEAEVQTAPVRPSAPLDARPLEARPPESRPAEAPPRAAGPSVPLKTQPRGLKAPYSGTALAQIAQADTAGRGAEAERAAAERPAAAAAGSGALPAGGSSGSGPAAGGTPGGPASGGASPAAARPPVAGSPAGTAAPAGGTAAAGASPGAAAASSGADARNGESPWAWPAQGRVAQGFEESRGKGIAIAGRAGDPVRAAADGRVIFSGVVRGYGNLVIVKHPGEVLTVYAHNRSLAVKEGESVRRGQKIAEIGDSDADRVKLHFEIRRQGKPVDPLTLLPPR